MQPTVVEMADETSGATPNAANHVELAYEASDVL